MLDLESTNTKWWQKTGYCRDVSKAKKNKKRSE